MDHLEIFWEILFSQLWPDFLLLVVEPASQEQDREGFSDLSVELTGMKLLVAALDSISWQAFPNLKFFLLMRLIARLETEGWIWYSSHCGLDCNALEISSIDRSGKDSSDFPIIDNWGFSKEITLQLPIKIQALWSYYDHTSVQRYIPSMCLYL